MDLITKYPDPIEISAKAGANISRITLLEIFERTIPAIQSKLPGSKANNIYGLIWTINNELIVTRIIFRTNALLLTKMP